MHKIDPDQIVFFLNNLKRNVFLTFKYKIVGNKILIFKAFNGDNLSLFINFPMLEIDLTNKKSKVFYSFMNNFMFIILVTVLTFFAAYLYSTKGVNSAFIPVILIFITIINYFTRLNKTRKIYFKAIEIVAH